MHKLQVGRNISGKFRQEMNTFCGEEARGRVERFGDKLVKVGRTCFTLGSELAKAVEANLQWGETT